MSLSLSLSYYMYDSHASDLCPASLLRFAWLLQAQEVDWSPLEDYLHRRLDTMAADLKK